MVKDISVTVLFLILLDFYGFPGRSGIYGQQSLDWWKTLSERRQPIGINNLLRMVTV